MVVTACGAAVTSGGSGSLSPSPHASSHSATASASASSKPAAVITPSTVALPNGGSQVTLAIAEPYTPSAPNGGTDDYHCFLVDPGITSDTFLTGVTFLPGNPKVVHHAILFRVPPASVAAAKAQDAQSPGDGWTCFGDTGIPRTSGDPLASLNDAPWLSAWAPGGKARDFGEGYGVPMAAGTQVVLQVHYNLLAGDGSDASGVQLKLSKPGAKLTPLETTLLPAPVELPCPDGVTGPLCDRGNAVADVAARFGPKAGGQVGGLQMLCGGDPFKPVAGPTQHCDRYIQEKMTIVAAAGHMHLLGRSISIDKIAADGTVTPMINIPVWNFDDQGSRVLPKPITVGPGDKVRVTCTHDARLREMLPELKGQQPRYVVWGEGTSDEMCLGILTVVRS